MKSVGLAALLVSATVFAIAVPASAGPNVPQTICTDDYMWCLETSGNRCVYHYGSKVTCVQEVRDEIEARVDWAQDAVEVEECNNGGVKVWLLWRNVDGSPCIKHALP
ncbi:MAG TPA: hypothetical protein VNZ52_01320 [Candidatus Thermoplasmatota archaeon]|nr:hypothetical protein [Candidatus Thermoplasmatota archaeon]